MNQGPLSGVVVLDLTRYLAGPYCTLLLAGLGAEVIKVESPGIGDRHRVNPPYAGPAGAGYERSSPDDCGLTHLHRARNKKSITLNLRDPDGVAMFRTMCSKVDVVVENYSPGVLHKMGIDYGALSEINPGILLCSISGFGQTGPLREWRAYDPIIQGMSGIASVTGYPENPPVRCGAPVSDVVAPLFGVIGILAALRRREQSGQGEWIDVAMLDTSVFLMPELVEYMGGGLKPERRGNDHAGGTPLNTYAARDGYVTVAIASDKDWNSLLRALGRDDLRGDERFGSRAERRAHIGIIEEIVSAWVAARTVDEAVAALQASEVPSGPVLNLAQAMSTAQLEERNMSVEIPLPGDCAVPGVRGFGMPIRFVDNPLAFDQPAPALGAHNVEIYERLLNLDCAARAALTERGVI